MSPYRRLRFVLALLPALALPAGAEDSTFVRGVDLTDWDRHAIRGTVYRDAQGVPVALPALLREHGIDTVRLQVLRTSGFGGAQRQARVAASLRTRGLRVWIVLHFAPEPAGPLAQPKPAEWSELAFAELATELRRDTRKTMETFQALGGRPDFVQLGQEIGNGILWDDGRIGGEFDSPESRERLAILLKAAAEGVRDVFADRTEIVIHVESGGDPAGARDFFDGLVAGGVPFDRIGLSYYPWYQGTLAGLEETLRGLAERYGRPVGIAETAYPWTLAEQDEMLNEIAQAAQLHPGFDSTPEGQAAFLAEVLAIAGRLPAGRAGGVIWNGPERIVSKGLLSATENLTLFDPDGRALPAWSAWQGAERGP